MGMYTIKKEKIIKHAVGDKVYVNFNDGVVLVEIKNILLDEYEIHIGGQVFWVKEHEVSLDAKKIKGVAPFFTPSFAMPF